MSTVRDAISGGGVADQLKNELGVLTNAERRVLLVAADCPTQMTTEETLAMKADLVLPWKKMRIMRR